MIAEHSKLFPFSSAFRWNGNACPGSVGMLLDEEDPPTQDSVEGDAAHWVLENMLNAFKMSVNNNGVDAGTRVIGVAHPVNRVIVTEEMFDAALTAYNAIVPHVKDKASLVIEHRVCASSIDDDAWGTMDVGYYDAQTNTVYVWDFKYGHLSVKAYGNSQLTGYAQALCETWKMDNHNPRLELTVIQPRCYDGLGPVRLWRTTLDELRPHVNSLRQGIAEYRAGTAKLKTGSWCRDCLARHKCPAIRDAAAVAIDMSSKPIPAGMSDNALAYELDVTIMAETRLERRKLALEAEADRRIRSGQPIPGYRLEDKFGRDAWLKKPDEIVDVCNLFGVNAAKSLEVKTPAQIISELKKKGVDAAVIGPYYSKSKTGVKLVQDDGTRAKQIFSQSKLTGEIQND